MPLIGCIRSRSPVSVRLLRRSQSLLKQLDAACKGFDLRLIVTSSFDGQRKSRILTATELTCCACHCSFRIGSASRHTDYKPAFLGCRRTSRRQQLNWQTVDFRPTLDLLLRQKVQATEARTRFFPVLSALSIVKATHVGDGDKTRTAKDEEEEFRMKDNDDVA